MMLGSESLVLLAPKDGPFVFIAVVNLSQTRKIIKHCPLYGTFLFLSLHDVNTTHGLSSNV